MNHPKQSAARPTIGLLIGRLGEQRYQAYVWPGVADVARERDANLICFVGGALRGPREFDTQRNIAYDLASPASVDGLVTMSGSLAQFTGPDYLWRFFKRYDALPIVSIALALEKIPSVVVDNTAGMHDLVTHLIEVHRFRRIAFVRGPEANPEAEQRYHAYQDILAKHGIPFDPDLVAPGDFLAPTGVEAVRLLLEQRKASFEAIVSANDEMALGVLTALMERGKRVPEDVSVAGFDNIEEARFASPPLTTIRQPLYEQGRQAAEMLLDLLEGKQVPEQVTLPTELVVRRSCGCLSPTAEAITVITDFDAPAKEDSSQVWGRKHTLTALKAAAGSAGWGLEPEWAAHLLEAFLTSLRNPSKGIFLAELDGYLRQTGMKGREVMRWRDILPILKSHSLAFKASHWTEVEINTLLQEALALVVEVSLWAQAYRRIQAERSALDFNTVISEPLMTAFDIPGLTDVIASQLPKMGIRSCYLSLYEHAPKGVQAAPSKWSRLILAYNEQGRIDLDPRGRRFQTHDLIPQGILPEGECFAIMLEPLHFRDEAQLGFVLFEPLQTKEGELRDALSRQISTAVKGALLLQEQKRTEAALRNSERKYRSLLEYNNEILKNAAIGIIRMDTEMRIQYENPDLERIIGLPPGADRSAAMGLDIRKLPGIQEAGLVPYLDDLQKGKEIAADTPFRSIYGKEAFVRVTGSPILENNRVVGSVLLVEDITKRKQAEDALLSSEQRYRILAEASHDMIFIINEGGTVEYVNEFASRQFGLQPESIFGMPMASLFSAEIAKRQYQNILDVLKSGEPAYIESVSRFPDGEKWLGTWLVPLKNGNRQADAVMGVARDISERIRANRALQEYSEHLEDMVGERTAELRDALEKAQMADKLKSEFIANINHELRTPLTNLILYHQMLQSNPAVKTQERLEVIGREVQRLRVLIEDLLKLSRLDTGQVAFRPMPQHLNLIIQTLVNDRMTLAQDRGLTLAFNPQPNLPTVWLDETMFVQIISNLLTNALNYTPAGGEIRISTSEAADPMGVPGVLLIVRDTGLGINQDDLPHLFKRFYRGKAGHSVGIPGTGLGLSIVKQMVEIHHGRIDVENVPEGQGAVFTVWLPMEQEPPVD